MSGDKDTPKEGEENLENQDQDKEEKDIKPNTPELTEAEQEAMEQGWVPKEKWVENGGDAKDWRSAEVFLERGVLYRKIHDLSSSNKEIQKTLKTLAEHNKKIAAKERENIIAELEADKLEALEKDDHKKVIEIDKKLRKAESLKVDDSDDDSDADEVDDDDRDPRMTEEQQREFSAWRNKNPWYGTDALLTEDADIFAVQYRQRHPEAIPQQIFNHVERLIKTSNPEKFKGKDVETPEAGGGGQGGKGGKKGGADLPDISELDYEYQKIARDLQRTAGLDPKDYVRQLRELGEI